MRLVFLSMALLAILACSSPNDPDIKPTIDQGIYGLVEFREGNFMPGSDPFGPSGKSSYVSRKIYIFEKTHINDVVRQEIGPFYDEIKTELIAETQSNSSGFYEIELPAGEYSIFVEEEGRYYGSMGDGYGYLMPVEVVLDRTVQFNIRIDYKAAY